MKSTLTDEEVELQIQQLRNDPDVKLAKQEERIRCRRRQYLYCLRSYQKKGAELRRAGITEDTLQQMDEEARDDL